MPEAISASHTRNPSYSVFGSVFGLVNHILKLSFWRQLPEELSLFYMEGKKRARLGKGGKH